MSKEAVDRYKEFCVCIAELLVERAGNLNGMPRLIQVLSLCRSPISQPVDFETIDEEMSWGTRDKMYDMQYQIFGIAKELAQMNYLRWSNNYKSSAVQFKNVALNLGVDEDKINALRTLLLYE